MKRVPPIAFALAAFLLTGCASDQVRISASPPHATISVDGKVIGTTPLFMNFSPDKTYLVRAEKAGYVPVETNSVAGKHKSSQVSPIAAGVGIALLVGGAVGGAVGGTVATAQHNVTEHQSIHFELLPLSKTNQNAR